MGGFRGCSVALMIIDCNHPKDSLDEVFFFFFFFTSQNKGKKKRACIGGKKKSGCVFKTGSGRS